MALHLQRRTQQFPTEVWEDIDRTADGIGDEQLAIGYDGPSKLSFVVTRPSHEIPWNAYNTFLRWWDDSGKTPDGADQSEANPAFEGWIEEITPGQDTNEVMVTAYDPTYRATRKVVCMSQPWVENPGGSTLFPVDGTGAYPRVAFNPANANDPDVSYAIAEGLSVGQIIRLLLDYQALPLWHCSAAPETGPAYDPDELGPTWESSSSSSSSSSSGESSGTPLPDGTLDFVPMEKVILSTESVRAAIERLLGQWAPEFKLWWQPGVRIWRVIKITDSPSITVTWNSLSEPVIPFGIDVRRSAEDKFGAIKFYGPEGVEWRSYTWTNPDIESSSVLSTLESIDPLSSTDGEGHAIKCHRTFRVTDPAFTKMMGRGATSIGVPSVAGIQYDESGNIVSIVGGPYVEVWGPQMLVRYEASAAGDDGWLPLSFWKADYRTGTIRFGDGYCMGRPNVGASGGEPVIQEPLQVRLVTPVLTVPLSVRYPSAGYAGTAYSIGQMEIERKEYDEQLAVAVEYGVPITTPLRLSRFYKMGQLYHARHCDLDHVGSITFDGLDYRWLWLNKRTNLAAKTDDGTNLTTGWENIGAFVTSVEFNVEECTTTVSFSDDQAEMIGLDMSLLKQRLKIRNAEYQFQWTLSTFFATRSAKTLTGNVVGQDITIKATGEGRYIDEQGGQQ